MHAPVSASLVAIAKGGGAPDQVPDWGMKPFHDELGGRFVYYWLRYVMLTQVTMGGGEPRLHHPASAITNSLREYTVVRT